MGIRDWFREKRAPNSIENPGVPISGNNILAMLGWDTASSAGIEVTPERAMTVPAVWAGVNFISSTIASLPLHVYRTTANGRQPARRDVRDSLLNTSPNEEWTSFRWRKYTMQQVLLQGRGYTYVERAANGAVVALWPMDPTRTRVIRRDMRTFYEHRQPNGSVELYPARDVIDLPWSLESDQVSHVRPVTRLREAIGLSIALQGYASRYFANGGVPPLALEGPFASPGAIERASSEISTAIKNAAAQGRQVLPLPTGHAFKQLGFNPEQSQFIEARRYMIEEIARYLNLSPVFLQDLTHGTFSNTEQQDLHVAKHTLTHWVRALEQEINLKLFTRDKRLFAEFQMDALLRGDFKTRVEGYSKQIQNGIKTPNEIRAIEKDEPLDGGDSLMIQQNMARLGALNEAQSNGN